MTRLEQCHGQQTKRDAKSILFIDLSVSLILGLCNERKSFCKSVWRSPLSGLCWLFIFCFTPDLNQQLHNQTNNYSKQKLFIRARKSIFRRRTRSLERWRTPTVVGDGYVDNLEIRSTQKSFMRRNTKQIVRETNFSLRHQHKRSSSQSMVRDFLPPTLDNGLKIHFSASQCL